MILFGYYECKFLIPDPHTTLNILENEEGGGERGESMRFDIVPPHAYKDNTIQKF